MVGWLERIRRQKNTHVELSINVSNSSTLHPVLDLNVTYVERIHCVVPVRSHSVMCRRRREVIPERVIGP